MGGKAVMVVMSCPAFTVLRAAQSGHLGTMLRSGSLYSSRTVLSGSPAPTERALQIGRTRWSGEPTSVLGTHDIRLRWAGSEVDGRPAGVRSLSSLHRCLVSSGRKSSLQSGERLADLQRDSGVCRSRKEAAREGSGALEAGLASGWMPMPRFRRTSLGRRDHYYRDSAAMSTWSTEAPVKVGPWGWYHGLLAG